MAIYGIGADEFLDLFLAQAHQCAVCKCPLVLFSDQDREKPVVDHCHATGAVRGILCRGCNVTIGYLEKDPGRTAAALQYLRGYRALARVAGVRMRPHPPPESSGWSANQFREWRLALKAERTPAEVALAEIETEFRNVSGILERASSGKLGVDE